MGFDKDQSLFPKDSRVGDKSCKWRLLSTILYHVQTFFKLSVCQLIIKKKLKELAINIIGMNLLWGERFDL